MHARVVRFDGVSQETIDGLVARIEEQGGPPPGVPAKGMKMFYDADQQTSVFVAFFDSAEDMAAGDAVLDAMDTGDTPGNRLSVDRCEVVIEREM